MWAMDWGLVGDIGATNARFALVTPAQALTQARSFLCEDYETFGDAIAGYLAAGDGGRPSRAVLAVAATTTGDQITLTNHPWTFAVADLKARFGLDRLVVINDFYANALAVPRLSGDDVRKVGGGEPAAGMPMGIIGPGSGLGVSAVVPRGDTFIPIAGEGGHVTMAAADDEESAVLGLMRQRYDHVSAERVLSGPGLVNLYNALCELAGKPAAALTAAQISDPQMAAEDACAKKATAMFCAMLGTVAGNLALSLGARGGIYIAGGIVPRLGEAFERSQFRARFEDKGRLRSYLAEIPTYVVVRPDAALLGAAQLLAD
jgi:glucokinase